ADADRVFGQDGGFATDTCNNGGVGGNSLGFPTDVAVDGAGDLYVAEGTLFGNNRVLEYDTPLTSDTTADRVFGQGGSFATTTCNNGGVSPNTLCAPTGDAEGGPANHNAD